MGILAGALSAGVAGVRAWGMLLGLLSLLEAALGGPGLPWGRTSCHLVGPGPRGPWGSLSFLAEGGRGPALFHAHWDARGALWGCGRRDEPELTTAFRDLCADEATRGAFLPALSPRLLGALAALRGQWEACREQRGGSAGSRRPRDTGRRRGKRGWTVPGTLWCGLGDSAHNFSELGLLQGPDFCCRQHDRCPHTISPLQYGYGVRNYRFHTLSHCDCDARWQVVIGWPGREPGRGPECQLWASFRQCLQTQHSSIADLLGAAFFNVLAIPCFVLEPQEACVAWYWWGGCKAYGSIPVAVIQPRTPYNASWNSPAIPGPHTTPAPQSPTSGKPVEKRGQRKWPPPHTEAEPLSGPRATAPQNPTSLPCPPSTATSQLGVTPQGLQGPPGAHRACRSLCCLDQCEHRIGPQETRFQLRNSAPSPLFHCDCTFCLARSLRLHGPPAGAEELLELLGTACFKLTPLSDCATGQGCPHTRAIRVTPRHLRRLRGPSTGGGQVWPSVHPSVPQSFYGQCVHLRQGARTPSRRQGPLSRARDLWAPD
ncbi:group 3 secretory phospholipase A2 isoform X1 [Erinaceus europaeus]|uniref:Group 3 secretory phospholipase A2 isoform X1 n=1 Tax=Erinaceus europaeus TaxID=9365 RepID=A0ABM3XIS1_ERIEU|nr:group 3 secretory phospholipase A2 isoform X1 [Erinaceus europaeus]